MAIVDYNYLFLILALVLSGGLSVLVAMKTKSSPMTLNQTAITKIMYLNYIIVLLIVSSIGIIVYQHKEMFT